MLLLLFQARIEQMGGDVALFLQSLRYNETEIGMLSFSTSATELVPIIPLNSDTNLDILLDNIPTVANGATCIGCGLSKAIEVSMQKTKGQDTGQSSPFTPLIGMYDTRRPKEIAVLQSLAFGNDFGVSAVGG